MGEELYPEGITSEEERLLYTYYRAIDKLDKIYDYQSKIHPLMHASGMANRHADIWREIEELKKLVVQLKPDPIGNIVLGGDE